MYSILVFGDSLSFGRGELPNNGWVARFKQDFETQQVHRGVYNLSIPGETSYSLKKRIVQETKPRIWRRKKEDYYVAIIQIGGNDAKEIISKGNSTIKLEEYVSNFQENISLIKPLVDEIIVVGLLQVNEEKTQPFDTNVFFTNSILQTYNSTLKEFCENNKITFIDIFNSVKLQEDEYFDGVHPNSSGHEKLYSYIKENLRHLL